MLIRDLWESSDPQMWEQGLARYWTFVKPSLVALEKELEALDVRTIHAMTPQEWYSFLHDKYFPWKYTAPNRLATTRAQLKKWSDADGLERLDSIRRQLLALSSKDTLIALRTAKNIPGLGVAGASGLVAILHPQAFAVVDQFVVKALRDVGTLPEHAELEKMNPESLTEKDGVLLTEILRRKAAELNAVMGSTEWNGRKVDKVLWTFGRV